jgi:chloramphenicol 3-O-phosphotransferase
VFAVVVTGAPGAGKTACLLALTDALIDDRIAHATIDVDEIAWAYPYPTTEERAALLGAAWEAHRRADHDLLVFGEVVESREHLTELLGAVGADDHLLVRLEAPRALLRQRILAREPTGWSGLEYLLEQTEHWAAALEDLDGVRLSVDTARTSPNELAARIRAQRPDKLGG